MKTIHFYISNRNHHWQMVRPVLAHLKLKGEVNVLLVSLCEFRRMNTPVDELTAMGIPYITLASLKFKGATTSTGNSFIGGNQSFIRNFLRAIVWYTKVRTAFTQLYKSPPDLIVVPNDIAFPFDRMCAWWNVKKIPFILFQEGIRFPLPNEGKLNYGKNGPQQILTWGNYSSSYFKSLQLQNVEIVEVGNPRFDEVLLRDYSTEIDAIKSEAGLGKYNILYVSNPVDDQGFCTHDEKVRLFKDFMTGLRPMIEAKDIKILVRLHPREDITFFKDTVAELQLDKYVVWTQSYSLFACLKVVDLSVVLASTVGLESMLCDVPIAVVKLPQHGFVFNYVSSGCALGIDVKTNFADSIYDALTDNRTTQVENCRRYVADQLSNRLSSAAYISTHLINHLGR